ncbi:MAG: hypothetical protein B5M55_04410 [Desulfococcus sp. 4484_242]|nr:MAG: hypothetical protein B5M55_04410 [Desulfococcus sp. 4484_242]
MRKAEDLFDQGACANSLGAVLQKIIFIQQFQVEPVVGWANKSRWRCRSRMMCSGIVSGQRQ